MQFYWLTLGVLGVWRITHMLYAEDGPWNILVKVRRAAGTGDWGKMLDCFFCTSILIALPFALVLGESPGEKLLLWFALSGGACLLQRITERAPVSEAVFYTEDNDKEKPDVVLRPTPDADSRKHTDS